MAHIKGTPKTGGRKKGTPNKYSGDVKSLISSFVGRELKNIDILLATADPEARLNFIAKLLPYILPKMQDVSITQEQPEDNSKYNDIVVTDEMREKAISLLMIRHNATKH